MKKKFFLWKATSALALEFQPALPDGLPGWTLLRLGTQVLGF
jgi:hypothetical protein